MTSQPDLPPEVLTPGQLAVIFKVDASTVADWAKAGKLPESFRTPGGHRRWYRSEIESFLAGER